MIAAILVMLASLLDCSMAVEAHQINLTNARLVVSPDRMVEVEIAMKGSDADRVAGRRLGVAGRAERDRERVERARPDIAEHDAERGEGQKAGMAPMRREPGGVMGAGHRRRGVLRTRIHAAAPPGKPA